MRVSTALSCIRFYSRLHQYSLLHHNGTVSGAELKQDPS